ncbi:MAG: Aspartyl/glutamyl-tRNA(Asn/Gln) amidotransferase subunit B [Alphaproteobacteria bacterium MarineAlpha10_Bin3]|nr:MAG: Aspartyl/glutamyl-tRNA(Asn/Gln) amidotransferase subunit B [Alphaproteobacteria bacterium MarineAlpha10_Bin3]PPR72581.1 MAG: Aspartyl/glutamyl-tRNA(Asn/Gln) amidotransferase subunit B [Alphaproteobacteria bacterium MarineAlpha4_Bin1]
MAGDWEIVIGLEVHAQITVKAKLFSGAATAFGAQPNAQVSLVDAGMPGMLPVLNGAVVRHAVRTGLALGAVINLHSVFARKNYFYPDMPQGYQISQYELPIVGEGELTIELADGGTRTVGIERLHLEQDAGKSLHDQHPNKSYIDLNRSGVALMEIVSKPDMRSAAEAAAYVTKLRAILRTIGSCDGNMQEGSLRCDANVSVRRPGASLGLRCEIKNLNSIRFMRDAIEYEAARQIAVIEAGGKVAQETRLYDPDSGETRSMRSKEDEQDYRYFSDPDLLPLNLDQSYVDELRDTLPELPDARKQRFMADHGLSSYDSSLLVADRETADYFEAVADGRDAKLAANWVISEMPAQLNRTGNALACSPVAADALGGLIDLIADGTISNSIAKDVLSDMFDSGKPAAAIVKERGLEQVSDSGALEAAVAKVMTDNPERVADYRAGNNKLLGWFMGQIMQASQGKANPQLVNQLLREKLAG